MTVEPGQPLRPDRPALPDRSGYLAALLLVSSTITWRQGSYYSGGVDPVVAAKALLGVMAAVLARRAVERCAVRQQLNGRPMLYLVAYLAVSLFGAVATGDMVAATAVLVVRLSLIAFTVYNLALVHPPPRLAVLLAGSMSFFALAASVTGSTAGSLSAGPGRLIGGVPALQPNEIAQICGLIVLVLLWRDLEGRGRTIDGPAVFVLITLIWLTGSRTTLGFLAVGIVLLLVLIRRFNIGFALAFLALVPLGVYAAFGTSSVSDYFNRGGSTNLLTFNQRTVAWEAALHLHHGFWEVWFGDGLSRVTVPVVAQYRSEQLLDSSWLSALVQSGIVGAVILALWVLDLWSSMLRSARSHRALLISVVAFVVLLATFESGLVNATPLFLFVLFAGLSAVPHSRARTPGSGVAPPTRQTGVAGPKSRLRSEVPLSIGPPA